MKKWIVIVLLVVAAISYFGEQGKKYRRLEYPDAGFVTDDYKEHAKDELGDCMYDAPALKLVIQDDKREDYCVCTVNGRMQAYQADFVDYQKQGPEKWVEVVKQCAQKYKKRNI